MQDAKWMLEAVLLGEKGRVDAPPNPWVGCVIVKDQQKVGAGFHPACGEPHAEVFALKEAGYKARGATAYVTLEPCSHQGRTSPCVQALLRAGISKVNIGVTDPDSRVSGEGIKQLRDAGITVVIGIEELEVKKSLAPYLHHRKTSLPYVVAKAAVSVDGRVAAKDGSSQWISSYEARADAHRLRSESQAVLIGSGTAVSDRPRLTVRDANSIPRKQPLRVILDRPGNLTAPSPLLDLSIAPSLIFTENGNYPDNIETMYTTNLLDILKELGSRDIVQLLVEGGSQVISSFLKQNFIQELVLYTGPKIIGNEGIPLFKELGIDTISDAYQLELINSEVLGDTIKNTYLSKVPTNSP